MKLIKLLGFIYLFYIAVNIDYTQAIYVVGALAIISLVEYTIETKNKKGVK